MYLNDEVDGIDYFRSDVTYFLAFIREFTCLLEYFSTLFRVPVARGVDHHRAILPKMPSTIVLHVTT
jgi:hypothetical protein